RRPDRDRAGGRLAVLGDRTARRLPEAARRARRPALAGADLTIRSALRRSTRGEWREVDVDGTDVRPAEAAVLSRGPRHAWMHRIRAARLAVTGQTDRVRRGAGLARSRTPIAESGRRSLRAARRERAGAAGAHATPRAGLGEVSGEEGVG